MHKRLFNEYEAYTQEGQTLSSGVESALEDMVDNLAEQGYSIRDIESIIIATVGAMLSERIVRRSFHMRNEARKSGAV
jgi:hypothetical protein